MASNDRRLSDLEAATHIKQGRRVMIINDPDYPEPVMFSVDSDEKITEIGPDDEVINITIIDDDYSEAAPGPG